MTYYDIEDEKTPFYKWLINNKYVNYDNIPKLLELLNDHIETSNNKYKNRQAVVAVLKYVTDVVKTEKLENDLYFVEEYYDQLLSHRSLKKINANYYYHIDILLYLNETQQGKELLKKHGIDFSKHGKLREVAFDKYLNGHSYSIDRSFNIEKLQQFMPKELDGKSLLDKNLNLDLCIFLTNNGIEISQTYLCKLANKVYLASVSDDYRTNHLYNTNNLIDKFTNMLVKNSNFVNFIASRSNLDLGIYHYFDRVFPIPKNLDIDELEKSEKNKSDSQYKQRTIFNNEFSIKLYGNPGYKYINLNTKMVQKVNLKLSGSKFVTLEEQEENLKKQEQMDQIQKPATRRLKI